MKLSFYMFNDEVQSFDDLVNENKITEDNHYQELDALNSENEYDFEFRCFIQKDKPSKPKWIKYIKDYLEIPDDFNNKYSSFIGLIKVNVDDIDYFFAVTFGYGRSALNLDNIQTDFSLKVALNSINPDEIKLFDVRNIDLITIQKRVVLNTVSDIGEFDFDFFQDIINKVEGRPLDEEFGTKISGSYSSFTINCSTKFHELGAKCREFVRRYTSNNYQEHFSFIDDIRIVKNKSLIGDLRSQLVDTVNSYNFHSLTIAYPDMIKYDNYSSFKIKWNRSEKEYEEMTVEGFEEFVRYMDRNFQDYNDLNQIYVIAIDDSGNAVSDRIRISNFIVFETDFNGGKYILSLGNWFKIDDNYYQDVDRQLMNIPLFENYQLRDMTPSQHEGEYNNSVVEGNPDRFLLLDKDNFQPQAIGRSKIEVCDILSRNFEFFAVKKRESSATLSHLFAQGSVSATLLKSNQEYRQYIVEHMNEKWELNIDDNALFENQIVFIYAIATNRDGDVRLELPFFSKVNLINNYYIFRSINVPVKILKINIA